MTGARIRLVLAALAFVGWLSWLAVAVAQKDNLERVSRAQLTEAKLLVVAEVRTGPDGLPLNKVRIVQSLHPNGPIAGTEIEIANLPAAALPSKPFPGAGTYLLPLVPEELGSRFRIAGLPRSPGYERQANPERPNIYPWSADVKTQLKTLGYTVE